MKNNFTPPYFEWWYFHFITHENWFFNFVVHATDMYGMNCEPYMSFSICNPVLDEKYYVNTKLNKKYFQHLDDTLNYSDNFLRVTETKTNISIEARFTDCAKQNNPLARQNNPFNDMSIKIHIDKKSPPLKFNDNVLCGVGDKVHNWHVTLPDGKFSASIIMDKKQMNHSGYIYHDHNWGDLLIQNSFGKWTWGNVQFDEGSFTYYYLITKDNKKIKYAYLILNSEQYMLYEFDETNLFTNDNNKSIQFTTQSNDKVVFRIKSKYVFKPHERELGNCIIQYERSVITTDIAVNDIKYDAKGVDELLFIRQH
jgi:hypothetical protein